MKSIVLAVLLAATLQTSGVAQQNSFIAVSIATPTPAAKSGKEVRIDVIVVNSSDHVIRLYKALGPDGQAEAANDIEVHNSEGKVLPRIDGRAVKVQGETLHLGKLWPSRTTVPVEPGKASKDFLILSNLFNLSKPGEYTVVVRHKLRQLDAVRPEDKMILVPSSPLTITVLPADNPQSTGK